MIRKEGESGRRPILATFVGNNRQMLQEIRDSLSHHLRPQQDAKLDGQQQQQQQGQARGDGSISQSTPNLNGSRNKRFEYNQTAMAEIRKSLDGFQISESPNSHINHCVPNGLDMEIPVNKRMLQQLIRMGHDEVRMASTTSTHLPRLKDIFIFRDIFQPIFIPVLLCIFLAKYSWIL